MIFSKKYLDYNNEQEYYQKVEEIQNKVNVGDKLTYQEIGFFCNALTFPSLRNHKFCDDEFFSRSHLEINIPDDIKDDPSYAELLERYGREVAPLTEDDKQYYQSLIDQWEDIIKKENHKDQLLLNYCIETRKEIKNLKREYKINEKLQDSTDFLNRKKKILEFSKYRYIITRGVFEIIIKNNNYRLRLNGVPIFYNYHSLSHILTWHYGLPMKKYITDKSHFALIFYENIHIELEKIFKKIDKSGFYSNDSIFLINFKINDILYRVCCKEVEERGKKIFRIETFFPIENIGEIQNLNVDYYENIVDREFSIYTRR